MFLIFSEYCSDPVYSWWAKYDQGNIMAPDLHDGVSFGENIEVVSGNIPSNIHPGRRYRVFTLRVNMPAPDDYLLPHYFSTEQGFVPESIKPMDIMNLQKALVKCVYARNAPNE